MERKMIIGTVTVTRSMVLAALAIVSFLMAVMGLLAGLGLDVKTPGLLAMASLTSRPHYFSSILGYSILGALALWVTIDWAFWFAVMCAIYFLVAKLVAGSKSDRNARTIRAPR
jgi:hypothetical protein